jgi:hypothetical protein
MPWGRDVSLWVGGWDVKANFVPKIDIVGLVRIALLNGREPLFLRVYLGVYLVQAEISLVWRYALQTY